MTVIPKTWTFTARRIERNRITFGFSFSRYPKSENTRLYGWGMCLNLLLWYVDVNYRKEATLP